MRKIILGLCMMGLLLACNNFGSKNQLAEGIWRVVLSTESGMEIPFNFELMKREGNYRIEIMNGSDRFAVDSVVLKDDSLKVVMPLFGGQFNWKLEKGVLTGSFRKGSYEMPCVATPNTSYRFFKNEEQPAFDVTGKWAVTLSGDMKAVGEWQQQGSKVTGSILTASGDFRYLEGVVTKDSMFYLSGFDGGFVMLFTGKLRDQNTLPNGQFYSGYSNKNSFVAERNDSASLPDATSITTMREGEDKLVFSFPNLQGKMVSLSDEQFKNKVVVVQFSGSWCPNCLDETAFLSEFYNANRSKVEVVCLAFERSTDFETAKAAASKLAERCKVQYDVLITGIQPKPADIMAAMPMLVNFKVFPTSIVVDKKGKVRHIHAGFSGPGTGKYYQEYINEFTALVNQLAAE